MKFFDRWFYRKARWCWHRAGVEYPEVKAEQDYLDEHGQTMSTGRIKSQAYIGQDLVCTSDNIDLERPIRFKVAEAEGGMIVETSVYDSKNDRNITRHHIVPDNTEDKAAEIARIIMWEFLRKPQ